MLRNTESLASTVCRTLAYTLMTGVMITASGGAAAASIEYGTIAHTDASEVTCKGTRNPAYRSAVKEILLKEDASQALLSDYDAQYEMKLKSLTRPELAAKLEKKCATDWSGDKLYQQIRNSLAASVGEREADRLLAPPQVSHITIYRLGQQEPASQYHIGTSSFLPRLISFP